MDNVYKNGKIYSITSPNTPKIYVGSTIQSLKTRMCGHRSAYKHFIESNHPYQSSFDIFKSGDAVIELIENFSCDNKNKLFYRENYWIQKLDTVNKRGRNKHNSVNDRKAYMKDYMLRYKKKASVTQSEKLNALIKKKKIELDNLEKRLLEVS